jgi:hypothetical protein
VWDQHVIGAPYLDAVQPDGRQRIESFEDEVAAGRAGWQLRGDELARVPPLVRLERSQRQDVIREEGLRDQTGAMQVQFHVAGNGRRDRCQA